MFDGDSDAVDFAALGSTSFLDGVREVVGIEKPAVAAPEPEAQAKGSDVGLLGSQRPDA